MGKVIVGISMSLDGYINDDTGSLSKLYPDFESQEFKDYVNKDVASIGAVIMGRKTVDMAGDLDSYAVDYEYQVPIFVLTHNPPEKHPKENENLTFTFITTGIKDAVEQAKKAAGDKDVVCVGGSDVAMQILNAGLADELHTDIIPVLLKSGTRYFDGLKEEIELEKIKVFEVGQRTGIQFKIIR
jgi:dihydrofolate reductase